MVDRLPNPLQVRLRLRQDHDSTRAVALSDGLRPDQLVVHCGGTWGTVIDLVGARNAEVIIPLRQRATHAEVLPLWYRERQRVVSSISKIEQFRRVFAHVDLLLPLSR